MSPENAIKWKFVKMRLMENREKAESREKREKLQKWLYFSCFDRTKT